MLATAVAGGEVGLGDLAAAVAFDVDLQAADALEVAAAEGGDRRLALLVQSLCHRKGCFQRQ